MTVSEWTVVLSGLSLCLNSYCIYRVIQIRRRYEAMIHEWRTALCHDPALPWDDKGDDL